MSNWIENLRKKPQAKKIKLLWITVGVSVVVLAFVIFLAQHYSYHPDNADTTFFKTLGQGFRDVKNYYKK